MNTDKLPSAFPSLQHRLFVLLTTLLVTLPLSLFASLPAHAQATCNHMGRTQNADGTYTFAQLHVDQNGMLADPSGCRVNLLGAQGRGATMDGDDGFTIDDTKDFKYLATVTNNSNVTINELRIPVGVRNWLDNQPMPDAPGMLFQDFVKAYVQAIEQQGDFVQIDVYEDFGSATLDDQVNALKSMATTFLNDQAVVMEVRNEGLDPTYEPTHTIGLQDDNAWLNAVQSVNPNVIKVTYVNFIDDMMNDPQNFPFYTQSNLLIDTHVYDGFHGTSPYTQHSCSEPNPDYLSIIQNNWPVKAAFIHQHGAGYTVNEWGGCYDIPDYNTAITNGIIQNDMVGLSYFEPGNWFYGDNMKEPPDGNAELAQQAYTAILNS